MIVNLQLLGKNNSETKILCTFTRVQAQSRPTLCDPIVYQAPLSMGFSKQEYFSGLPFPPPGESSWLRDQTHFCTGRWILNSCAIWEAHSLTQFPLMVTFCKTVAQYHIQDVYTNSVKTKHCHQLQGPSCCPFITTPTSFQPRLHPTYFSESLTTTNLLSSSVIRLIHKCFINGIIGYADFWNCFVVVVVV